MQFRDAATEEDAKGLRYVNDDASWMVCASDRAGSPWHTPEWFIWQRAVPGDRRRVSQGYVQRLPWARFKHREEAQAVAAVLDDLPATASLTVALHAVRTRVREVRRDALVWAIATVAEAARRARDDTHRAVDDPLR